MLIVEVPVLFQECTHVFSCYRTRAIYAEYGLPLIVPGLQVFRTNSSYDRCGERYHVRLESYSTTVLRRQNMSKTWHMEGHIVITLAHTEAKNSPAHQMPCMRRWWEARRLWGGLLATTTDIVRQVRSAAPSWLVHSVNICRPHSELLLNARSGSQRCLTPATIRCMSA